MAKNQTIQHKRSTVAGNMPTAAQVAVGELAINFADRSIYTKTPSGTIIELERDVIKSDTTPPSVSSVEGDLWYNTTTDELFSYDGVKWTNVAYGGKSALPVNTTASPTWSSGSGTSASPYVFSISPAAGATVLITTMTVTGLNPNQFVPITDTNGASNGGRFTVSNFFADAGGVLRFNILFTDAPTSPAGTNWTANIRVGTATVYVTVNAAVASTFPQSVSSPTSITPATTTWTASNNTLTSTGDLLISLDGSTFGTGPLAITTGATLYSKWDGVAGSGTGIDGTDGSTITGSVLDNATGSTTFSLVIDKTPVPVTFADVTGAALSTAITSDTVTVSGINSYVYLTSSDAVLASVNGAAFTPVPASGTSMYLTDSQTLQLRQTSSGTISTTTTVNVSIGGVSATFNVTTASSGTINTPSITSPVTGSTGISSTATLTSSAYTVTGIVGTHLNTDWEIYNNSSLTGPTVASSLADAVNKTTWTPTGLGYSTQYWAHVRYRSNDTTAVESSWSTTTTWTTAGQPGADWTYQDGLRSTTWNTGGTGVNVYSVVWTGTQFLVVGMYGRVATSPDGINWTYQGGLSSTSWGSTDAANSVVWTGTQFLVVGVNGRVATSPNGINWTYQGGLRSTTWGTATAANSVVWTGTQFLVVGVNGRVATSPNGINWTYQGGLRSTTWGSTDAANSVVWTGTQFLVVGDGGKVATSPDGINWTYQGGLRSTTWGSTDAANSVVWTGTQFLVVGDGGKVATSPNGINWTYQSGLSSTTWGTVAAVISVVWTGTQFLVVGGGGRVATSPDGINWTYQGGLRSTTWGTASDAYSVVWTGTQFLVVGSSGKVATSP